MRVALLGLAAFAALGLAAPASAGCWATVGASIPRASTAAGDVWTAELTILQHGRTPLPPEVEGRPTLTIVNSDTGETKTFAARPAGRAGAYTARVVFPSAGRWSYEVYDGFDNWDGEPVPCGRTHTFGTVEVGAAAAGTGSGGGDGGGFPAWPVAGGLGGGLAAVLGLGIVLRRRGLRTAPSA